MNPSTFVLCVLLGVSIVQGALDRAFYGPKLQELVDILHKTCVEKTNVDETLITRFANGDFVDDAKLKAYIRCLLLEGAVTDEDGTWNYDLVSDRLLENISKVVITNLKDCDEKTQSQQDLEQRAYDSMICVYNKDPDTFIMF